MSDHGINWQAPLKGTLHLGRTNRFFLGGGKALLNSYYHTAQQMGIAIRYNTLVEDLLIEDGKFRAVIVKQGDKQETVRGRAVVVAAGGFEANIEWLKRFWGDAADNFVVRGTPYNDGTMLATLFKKGAQPIGDPKGFHAIAVDARAPKFDGGIVTRLDSIPFGIVVNRLARRFYDEGEDIWPKRYAIWGGLIAAQPDQIAYSILDSKTIRCFLPPVFKPFEADSLEDLASALKLEPSVFVETIRAYNRATAGNESFRIEILDGTSTARDRSAQEQLGGADRSATLLRSSPAPRHHLHVYGCYRGRDGAGGRPERTRVPQRVCSRRNYVWQHPHQRVSGWVRFDDRLSIR